MLMPIGLSALLSHTMWGLQSSG